MQTLDQNYGRNDEREDQIASKCFFPTHNTNQRRRHKNVYNDQRMLRQELRFMVIALP